MTMQIRKAERHKAKLRLGISAPTGAGKTYSSLLIASGISQKVGLIDTENGSGDLYADDKAIRSALPGGYDIINLSAPFDPAKYIEAIQKFEDAGYGVIIIDSLSHAWAGAGGLLDKQGRESDKTGNSYTAWRKVTPQHNALVDKLIQSPSHIIACIRAKTEYVQEKNEQGKTVVRKVGMAPIFRDGFEYEMTIFGEMDHSHNFQASKDRTGLFGDQFFVPSKKTGEMLLSWLNSGKEVPIPAKPTIEEKLGDEIPSFEPKHDVEVSLEDKAKSYAEFIKGSLYQEELEREVLSHAPLMGSLIKEKPDWHKRLMELIEQKRAEFIQAQSFKPDKPPRKKKETSADNLNDPLPDNLKLTDAQKLEQQLYHPTNNQENNNGQ
jgi:hypothetical protein